MIIIEGCDGSGKTTLADMLLRDGITANAIESPRRTKRDEETLAMATASAFSKYSKRRDVSVDRLVFSELVYGTVIRNGPEFTYLETFKFIKQALDLPNILIFCIVNPDELKFKPDENELVKQRASAIVHLYYQWFQLCLQMTPNNNVFHYRWTTENSYDRLIHCFTKRGLI